MKHAGLVFASLAVGLMTLASCTEKGGEKKQLTRAVFVAAVSKCQPLDAKFIESTDGPPSVEITIAPVSSTVPDCMAKEFDGYALKQLQINYQRSSA